MHRYVQHPSQSADASPSVPEPSPHIKPTTSAASGGCPPDTALHQDNANCEEVLSATASDLASAPASPGCHRVGLNSTWAVRQSAELEDLQAALDKQCFSRGRQTAGARAAAAAPGAAVDVAAAAAANEEDIVPPQDLQDAVGPKYGDPHAASADDALLCFSVCNPH